MKEGFYPIIALTSYFFIVYFDENDTIHDMIFLIFEYLMSLFIKINLFFIKKCGKHLYLMFAFMEEKQEF
jgi:hypothetical protein